MIRTTERNVLALYEARCALLALDPRHDGNVPSTQMTTAQINGASTKSPSNSASNHSFMSAAATASVTGTQCSNDTLTTAAVAAALAQQQQQLQHHQQQQLQQLQQQQANQLYLMTTTTSAASSPPQQLIVPTTIPNVSEANSQRAASWMDWTEVALAASQQRSCSLASLPSATLTTPSSATTPPLDVPSGQLSAVSTPVQHLSPSSCGGASSTTEQPPSSPPTAAPTVVALPQNNESGVPIATGLSVVGGDTAFLNR